MMLELMWWLVALCWRVLLVEAAEVPFRRKRRRPIKVKTRGRKNRVLNAIISEDSVPPSVVRFSYDRCSDSLDQDVDFDSL